MSYHKRMNVMGNFPGIKINKNPVRRFNPNQIIRHSIKSYYKNKNWEGLLKYLLLLEERKQLPPSWRWQIGQMYVYNNQAQSGLDYLYKLHFQDPHHPDVQLTIFEALKALKKSEHSFNWIKKPEIKAIERDTLLECYNLIREKKNAIPLFILYSILKQSQICPFDEFDLLFALKRDIRFHIFNDTCFFRFSRIDLKAEILRFVA